MLFKSKENKFDPFKDLRVARVKTICQGKVIRECDHIQFRNHDFGEDYWASLRKVDEVYEISPEAARKMGLEVPVE